MRRFLGVFAALLAALSASPAWSTPPGVELISSDDSGIVIRYEPSRARLRDASSTDRAYVVPSVADGQSWSEPGTPDLPAVRVRVAVPDCESVGTVVSTGGVRDVAAGRVLPVPRYVRGEDGDPGSYAYDEGPIYAHRGLWPESAAVDTGPFWLATQRVVEITFFPFRYDPSGNRIVRHDVIEVALTFRGVRGDRALRHDSPRREALFRAALVNYESGRAWRARPASRPERPGDYFDDSGNWARLVFRDRGLYKIGRDDLQGAGIDPTGVDPATIRVFSGDGLPLPADVTDPRPDWMEEIDILVSGEGDGSFDADDAVFFYVPGIDGWTDELETDDRDEFYFENPYANAAVCWLTWEAPGAASGFSDQPHRMAEDDLDDGVGALHIDSYLARDHFERNVYPQQGLSDNWFWYSMNKTGISEDRYLHEFLNDVLTDSTGRLRLRLDGGNSVQHRAICTLNGFEVAEASWSGFGSLLVNSAGLSMSDGYNTLRVTVPRTDPLNDEDHVFIDWFELLYWRHLRPVDDHLAFGSSGRTGEIRFTVEGFADPDVTVYKVLGRRSIRTIPGVQIEGVSGEYSVVFQDDVADTASYLAVSTSGCLRPEMEVDSFGDLRTPQGEEYIIITYDGFYDQALRLRNYRESTEGGGFSVRIARISDVYDEFSWGVIDPTAIRDYLKCAWDVADVPPTHVILVGDASNDFRNYSGVSIPCFIPAHYTRKPFVSWANRYWPTESWFVGFDSNINYSPAMAIGRLTARSSSELTTMIDKIVRYETQPAMGPWKNTVLLVGDDEFTYDTHREFFHTEQTEQLSTDVLPWCLDRRKIYLMEYERNDAGQKPAARAALLKAWQEGALILNYTGHGNEWVMAHEIVFHYDDVPLLKNLDALPLFFAASCRLNKFDQEADDSLGETLVKSAVGGAIGSIGSTRDSGASYNAAFNRFWMTALFDTQRVLPKASMDIGTAFQTAFRPSGSAWENDTKFSIMGDPALLLTAPTGGGGADTTGWEPMRRMDTITINGENSGATAGRDGVALVRVADTADTSGYYHTYSWPYVQVDYTLPGETFYEGSAPVADGAFGVSFVVSTLAEEGPRGRVRAYYYDDEIDGSFSIEDVAVADSVLVSDNDGPAVVLRFEEGGTSVIPGSRLIATISDDHGVNLIDRNPADGVRLAVDAEDTLNLTDEFVYDLGDYRAGTLEYVLPALPFGPHAIVVQATDNAGNRTTERLAFDVVSPEDFQISDVANHPNPFPDGGSKGTTILFSLPLSATVRIDVFTVGGRLLRTLKDIPAHRGANQVYWDGRDKEGDDLANGVYLYRVSARSIANPGDRAEVIGRAVVMR